ncbi:MAG TPA: oligoendopeptidase, partial [Nitrospiria bacterium]|nr:oligoendopeptidase [Nitrospiria bacterium]
MKKNTGDSGVGGARWRLSDLYQGVQDPAIEKDLDNLLKEALDFEKNYRGTLATRLLEPGFLSGRMKALEGLYERLDKIIAHAYLVFAGNSDMQAHGKYLQKVNEASTEIRNHLLFFILDWVSLPDARAEEALSDPSLKAFRHYLRRERAFRPHRLPEGEEKILDLKDDTGANAFMRLFDETLSRIKFRMVHKKKTELLTEQEILSLLHDPDRTKRKAAAEGMTAGLKENQHLLTFILNTLVADHATEDRIRSFSDPMSSRHLSNEIDPKAVSAMMSAVERRISLVSRFYRLKKKMMKLKTLLDYDRYAPFGKTRKKIPWNEGKTIVLNA